MGAKMRHIRLFEAFRGTFTKESIEKALDLAQDVLVFYHDQRSGAWYTVSSADELGEESFVGLTDNGDERELLYGYVEFLEMDGNRMDAYAFHEIIQNNVNTSK